MEGLRSWRNGIVMLAGSIGLLIAGSPAPAFFIRGGTPPPLQQSTAPVVVPPTQQSGGGGGGDPTPPPPPSGNGETPPGSIDPPVDPPNGTPEPASLLTALIGAGLTLGYAWRKRRQAAQG